MKSGMSYRVKSIAKLMIMGKLLDSILRKFLNAIIFLIKLILLFVNCKSQSKMYKPKPTFIQIKDTRF